MSDKSSSEKYCIGAYRKDEKRRGPISISQDEYVISVMAEIHLIQHDKPEAGSKENATPDELGLLKQGVKRGFQDARMAPQSRRPHEGIERSDELVGPEDNPHNNLIRKDQASLVHKAMKATVKKHVDKQILKLLFFDPHTETQAQVAKQLGLSESYVSKRLSAVLKALEDYIQKEGSSK